MRIRALVLSASLLTALAPTAVHAAKSPGERILSSQHALAKVMFGRGDAARRNRVEAIASLGKMNDEHRQAAIGALETMRSVAETAVRLDPLGAPRSELGVTSAGVTAVVSYGDDGRGHRVSTSLQLPSGIRVKRRFAVSADPTGRPSHVLSQPTHTDLEMKRADGASGRLGFYSDQIALVRKGGKSDPAGVERRYQRGAWRFTAVDLKVKQIDR